MSRNFCAIDGESFTVNGEHTYVLLASSDGDYVYDSNGIPTWRCFEYLLSKQGKTLVGFGFNYDVNMIVKDLDLRALANLWYNGKSTWNNYTLEWIPSKWFSIRRGRAYVKVEDTFGFFQTSFVQSLRKWGFTPNEEMASMKGKRGEFSTAMREEIIQYCLDECTQLHDLMCELEKALGEVDLGLRSWIGAGSIANALMRRYGVPGHHVPDSNYPPEVQEALQCAYFGGRSEVFLQGTFPKIYDYDISSAYPYQATQLPTLTNGTWRHATEYEPDSKYALWHCYWKIDPDRIVMPFPFRKGHEVFFPSSGAGWYHSAEVKAAKRLYRYGIEIEDGWVFEPGMGGQYPKPFAFIPGVYKRRQQLKQADHGGEKVLKLGLNALYGKMAQVMGYDGKPPPFQSLLWAGMITAGTRAKILDLAGMNPNRLVMVATDGIFFSTPIDVETTGGLGGLELTVGEDVFVAQPGVYAFRKDGEVVGRTRGFFSKEIDFSLLRSTFEKKGSHAVISYDTHRFCGLGYSLLAKKMEHWRTWQDSTRKLSLYPSKKFVQTNPYLSNPVRHYPSAFKRGVESEPYKKREHPLYTYHDIEQVIEYVQGADQPLRSF